MIGASVIVVACVLPVPDDSWHGRASMLENNHYFNENGDLVFVQLIAWDGDRVWFWRMNKLGDLTPRREHGAWVVRWDDAGVYRELRSITFVETWTQYDRELEDRPNLQPDCRRKLEK